MGRRLGGRVPLQVASRWLGGNANNALTPALHAFPDPHQKHARARIPAPRRAPAPLHPTLSLTGPAHNSHPPFMPQTRPPPTAQRCQTRRSARQATRTTRSGGPGSRPWPTPARTPPPRPPQARPETAQPPGLERVVGRKGVRVGRVGRGWLRAGQGGAGEAAHCAASRGVGLG